MLFTSPEVRMGKNCGRGLVPLFLQAFSDVLRREVKTRNVKFQKYDDRFHADVDLQSHEMLKYGMKRRVLTSGQFTHSWDCCLVVAEWLVRPSDSKSNAGGGVYTPAHLETSNETRGFTTFFALLFKDGVNKALALTGNRKGKPIKAVEKSATELYRQLSTLVQEPQEGSQSFLIRALDTRQKILFASKEADTQLKYDPALVQGMSLHAVDTGLQDEAIRTRLRPSLQNPNVQDEDLIQQMKEIVLEETERKSKLGSSTRHKSPKVNKVHASQTGEGAVQSVTSDKKLKRTETGNTKEDNFMAALQAVHSELATLKESIEKNQAKDERLTSAQVSIASKSWLGEYLPSLKPRNIAELLGEETGLNLIGANGGPIPFDGWVEVQFQLTSGAQSSTRLTVPLLVARNDLEYPIIGFNVIEEVIKSPDQMGEDGAVPLNEIMKSAFSEMEQEKVIMLVDLVQRTDVERLCVLRSSKNNLTVPRGQTVAVACRVDCGLLEERTPVLFEPAQEST
ncbi:hypothetical protein AWC38_SpisGene10089 [Stylophora pistillata]|uniref:Uncharacterized protein n=1 Tax=Stylophora pistillata TaxID=50429 RepID=A0A2B4S5Z4_STYPI|nr:hypothetical protein AWC38_SpisGene10089 [Stylophora pistillata]